MKNRDENSIGFVPIIFFVILTILFRFKSFILERNIMYSGNEIIDTGNVEELLRNYDFTGMTAVFLNVITILNLILLIFYLYLHLKQVFPDFFYKIFTVYSIVLILVSIFSFINIRANEEKIAKEFVNRIYTVQENTKNSQIGDTFKIINEVSVFRDDEFYEVKSRIYGEIEANNTFERYFYLFFFRSRYELYTLYYNLFSQFALLDFIIFLYFVKRIKKNDIEERVILNLFRN